MFVILFFLLPPFISKTRACLCVCSSGGYAPPGLHSRSLEINGCIRGTFSLHDLMTAVLVRGRAGLGWSGTTCKAVCAERSAGGGKSVDFQAVLVGVGFRNDTALLCGVAWRRVAWRGEAPQYRAVMATYIAHTTRSQPPPGGQFVTVAHAV